MVSIIGIDPGLQHTGWGIIDSKGNNISYIASGSISPRPSLPMAERLLELNKSLINIIESYRPQEVAIEETFVNKNSATSLKLGQARGALLLTVSLAGLPLKEYAATLVKKSVVGVGRAEKDQVAMMVKTILPACRVKTADEADALAVAICHANHSQFQNIVRKAHA